MRRNESSRPSSSRAFCTRTCYHCHATGHFMKNCPSPRACFNCGSTGHLMKDCSKPRAEGARDFPGSRGRRHGREGRGTSAGDSSGSFDSSETGRIVHVGGDEFSMGNAGVESSQPIGPAGFVSGASPVVVTNGTTRMSSCLLYTSPSPRDQRGSRMPSSA